MEILEEGNPVRVEYRGRCTKCNCLVSAGPHEVRANGQENYVQCPMKGCGINIIVKRHIEGDPYNAR